jgi:hypothetical protein
VSELKENLKTKEGDAQQYFNIIRRIDLELKEMKWEKQQQQL